MDYPCNTCGFRFNPPPGNYDCPRCAKFIEGQAPDFAQWVIDVVNNAMGKHEVDYYHNRRPGY